MYPEKASHTQLEGVYTVGCWECMADVIYTPPNVPLAKFSYQSTQQPLLPFPEAVGIWGYTVTLFMLPRGLSVMKQRVLKTQSLHMLTAFLDFESEKNKQWVFIFITSLFITSLFQHHQDINSIWKSNRTNQGQPVKLTRFPTSLLFSTALTESFWPHLTVSSSFQLFTDPDPVTTD